MMFLQAQALINGLTRGGNNEINNERGDDEAETATADLQKQFSSW